MSPDSYLEVALDKVRLENARLINKLRLIGVGLLGCVTGVAIYFFREDGWEYLGLGLSVYFVVAFLIWLSSERNDKIRYLSRFSIPVIDIPFVTGIQLFCMKGSGNSGQISEFTISIFICLLMISALTLKPVQTYLTLGFGIMGQQLLQSEAEVGLGGRLASAAVMSFAMWICLYAVRNRTRLIDAVTHADIKRKRLQRYFSPGIGELLESHSGPDLTEGKDCELTVVFTDLRGFSGLSEKLESKEIVSLLNEFHGRMVNALFKYAGTLDKYTGDGILAYFNAPIDQPDHAERAIRCALFMQSELAEMNEERRGKQAYELAMGIGIHSGRATVGEIGAPSRREYTAIGDTVNVAARVQQLSNDRKIPILISESAASQAPANLELESVGDFGVKGREEYLTLYTLNSEERSRPESEPSFPDKK
ncbi:MAG: adenylate/guanylate cyclase domain-containing protein [Akkermansiaceae bacterium]